MQHAVDEDGFDPRLRRLFSSVINALESNGVSVFSAHVAEAFGGYDACGQAEMVTRRDFEWMNACDVYVAVLPAAADNLPYRSDGSYVELGWASALGKPILLVSIPGLDHSLLVHGLGVLGRIHSVSIEDIEISPERIVEALHAAELGVAAESSTR